MGDKVFKKGRLVGCSEKGIERAIEAALAKAQETVHGGSWFEVVEIRGGVREGRVAEYQVAVDLGFRVD